MSDTLHPSLEGLASCGCCAGTTTWTPARVRNPEGLDTIAYRIGTYVTFRASMLAALSEAGKEPLHDLATRDPDDFTVALLDGWSVIGDILTFYQERLAQESYLRTAVEPGSVRRLARLIGYQPAPGVAASVWLAFTLDPSPGAPESVRIEEGVRVQSVPGQDEDPQTFETVQAVEARQEWNALRPRQTEAARIYWGQTELYLQGTATQLQQGDAILIVGDEREHNPDLYGYDERWDVRLLTHVEIDHDRGWTRVIWEEGLGHGSTQPAAKNVRVFAFRQRGALFGHNAPDPNMVTVPTTAIANHLFDTTSGIRSWKNYRIQDNRIDLDAAYAKVVPGGWIALMRTPQYKNDRGYVELYKALAVSFPSRTAYGVSGKVTRIVPDAVEHLDGNFFGLDETVAFFQSEQLAVAAPPLQSRAPEAMTAPIALTTGTLAPLEGARIALERQVTAFEPGRTVVVSGRRSRVQVALNAPALVFTDDADERSATLGPGDSLIVLETPAVVGSVVHWRLRHRDGFDGTLVTALDNLQLRDAAPEDPVISETVVVEAAAPGNPTEWRLAGSGLRYLYDRKTVTIAGNVALATHGETVEEIAGSGNAAQPFQTFALKQRPLTYRAGSGTTSLVSTLEVKVDDLLLWQAVPTLYQRGPEERIFVTRQEDGEGVSVRFGDGTNGARLPTGQQNVRFKYRKGSGLDGMVRAGQLTQLLTRPLGLRDVTNPLPAEGADAPEALEDARRNTPLTVLTLDRVVSLQDYEDYAAAYPGIGKALATWTWDGRNRGVLLTVAGPNGTPIVPGGLVETGLADALRAHGDPFVPIRIAPFRAAFFELAGRVQVRAGYEAPAVIELVRAELQVSFAFDRRSFGQPVMRSEVLGIMHRIAGVQAVDLDHLQRTDQTHPEDPAPRLLAEYPAGGASASIAAAELLQLAPGNLETVQVADL
ncbi:MAG: hypothetical protein E1N59_2037 [Puniceicoccaceae bacterium 5H]|nr:MAG: hypothetical protein E1N59_2037 [Puniceicoccaceae bacterium 5H]